MLSSRASSDESQRIALNTPGLRDRESATTRKQTPAPRPAKVTVQAPLVRAFAFESEAILWRSRLTEPLGLLGGNDRHIAGVGQIIDAANVEDLGMQRRERARSADAARVIVDVQRYVVRSLVAGRDAPTVPVLPGSIVTLLTRVSAP